MFALLAVLLVCSSVLGDYNCILNGTDSPTAADCPYSDIVCKTIDTTGKKCENKLQNRTSDYSEEKSLFFSDEEIEEFIDQIKVDFDEIKDYLEEQREEIVEFLEEEYKNDPDSSFKKIYKPYRRLVDNTYRAVYDSNESAYRTANSFNLGAISLAMYPINYFTTEEGMVKPLVKNSIIKEIKEQCDADTNLMEDFTKAYISDICDIFDVYNITGTTDPCASLENKLNDIQNAFVNKTICDNLANKVEFKGYPYLVDKFNKRYAPQILLYETFVNYIFCRITFEESKCNKVYFGNETVDQFLNGFNYTIYWEDLTGSNAFIKKDETNGFDIWEATKDSPSYKNMVKEYIPDDKPKTDGMAWWAILLIVLGSILVVAGIVVCVMYFLKKGGNGPSAPKEPKKPKTTKTKINGDNLNNNLMDDRESSDLM